MPCTCPCLLGVLAGPPNSPSPAALPSEKTMNFHPLHRIRLLVIHPDPILCAGLVAALREQPGFEVLVHDDKQPPPDTSRVDVVLADYKSAMQLTEPAARRELALGSEPRILVITANDREADIRRAIEAGVYG